MYVYVYDYIAIATLVALLHSCICRHNILTFHADEAVTSYIVLSYDD